MGIAVCKRGHLIHADGFYKDGSCKLCAIERKRKWRNDNQEKLKEYNKEYYKKNSEKVKKKFQSWYVDNKERYVEKCKVWALANVERIRSNSRKWTRDNPEKVMINNRRSMVEISDSYVRNKLGLKKVDVPQEVIELKRQHIILKRELTKWKQSQL